MIRERKKEVERSPPTPPTPSKKEKKGSRGKTDKEEGKKKTEKRKRRDRKTKERKKEDWNGKTADKKKRSFLHLTVCLFKLTCIWTLENITYTSFSIS